MVLDDTKVNTHFSAISANISDTGFTKFCLGYMNINYNIIYFIGVIKGRIWSNK